VSAMLTLLKREGGIAGLKSTILIAELVSRKRLIITIRDRDVLASWALDVIFPD
jgi:hypothetical protein